MDGAHETGVTTARRAEYDRVEFVGLVSNLGDHCGSFLSGSSIVDSDAGTGTMGGSRGMWAAGVGDAGESGRVRLETLFQKKKVGIRGISERPVATTGTCDVRADV